MEPGPEDRASALRWFAVSVAALIVVVGGGVLVARSTVRGGRTILAADEPVLRFMAGHRTGAFTAVARVVSTVASPVGLILTVGLISAYTVWRTRHFGLTVLAWITLVGVGVIDTASKLVVARPRPPTALRVTGVSASGLSFPSGHTIQSAAVYGVIAVMLWRADVRVRPLVAGSVAAFMIVAVGLSRVYLGVHWISDVLAGAMFGLGWLAVVLTGEAALGIRRVHPKSPAPNMPAL